MPSTPAAEPTVEPLVAEQTPVSAPTPITITTPEESEPAVDVAEIAASTVINTAPAMSGITDLDTPEPAAPAEPVKAELPDIERPSAEVWAVPTEDTVETPSVSDTSTAVAEAEASVQASSSQSLADEEAAIAQQIENIIDTAPDLNAAPTAEEPATPSEAPTTAEVPTMPELPEPEEPEQSKPAAPGQKVIQPLVADDQESKPTIHELAAKESDSDQATHPTGTVIQPQSPAAGGIDPNSLAL